MQTFASRETLVRALLVLALAVIVQPAFAQTAGGQTSIETFLQNIVNVITGRTGQLLSVLAVAFAGLGALSGQLSLRTVAGVAIGVMIIFSAAWVVGQITGGTI